MPRKMSQKYVINRLAMFDIPFVKQVNVEYRGPTKALLFDFPKRQGVVLLDDKLLKEKPAVLNNYGKITYPDHAYTYGSEAFYVTKRSIEVGGFDVEIDFYDVVDGSPRIELCREFYEHGIKGRLEFGFWAKDPDIEKMCYDFCQKKMDGGILLDALKEHVAKIGVHL